MLFLCRTVSLQLIIVVIESRLSNIDGFIIFKAKRSHSRDGHEKYKRERHEEDKRATKALADLRER